jgi:putative transposase
MSRVKTSLHPIKFANKAKNDNLSLFIDEYRRVAQLVVDNIWTNGYEWEDKKGNHSFSITQNELYFPSMMKGEIIKQIGIDTFLTARATKCLLTQVAGMIGAETEKQRKRLYMLDTQKEEGRTKKQRHQLAKRVKQNIPVKPNCSNMNCELNTICCDWQETDGYFDGYLCLKSITKTKMEIKIPIKFHKHSRKLSKTRDQMTSYLISKSNINIRWKKDLPVKKTSGEVVGADQGMKDVLTCSDKQQTPNKDKHGHSLETIMRKLARCKKGSNNFKKTQDHRKNFINWSLNQLNLDGIKEIRLEKVWNIGYKSKTSRLMQHWTNTLIRDKVESICAETGVQLKHQSSTYRSQRCSGCGVVRKANRKGKLYMCKHCGLEIDADYNASLNHIIDLPEIPYNLRKLQMNRGNGFYWLESGFYEFETGRCLQSLPPVEVK